MEKYRPRKVSEVIGNEDAKGAFMDWLKAKNRTKKAILLVGPPGVGKTTLVNAAANEFGFRVIEMNASDTRSEKEINAVARPATSYVGLETFSTEIKGSVLFLDEVDGIAGNEDRGGVSAIVEVVENSRIPVIMAANDPDLEKLRPLKKVSTVVRFHQVRTPCIILMLKKICREERIQAEFGALERIAQNSGGDVRSAINDLQSLAETDRILTVQDTKMLSYRNKDISMEETLTGYFSVGSILEAATLLSRSSVDYDELLMAISDNLPCRYSDRQELGRAYDPISKADMFRGRIGTENWHLLKYFYNYLSEAAAISPGSYKPFALISPPLRVMALFWTKGKRASLDGICAKIGAQCHISKSEAKSVFAPYLKAMLRRNKAAPIAGWLGLTSEEVDYLVNMTMF